MRNLLVPVVLAVVLVVVGCKSNNPSGRITGPFNESSLLSGTLTPPPPPNPVVTPAFFGTISNLNLVAGTFTLTSPSGATEDVTTTVTTIVRFQDFVSTVSTSVLKNGELVTVTSVVAGAPSPAKVRALLIIINSGAVNQPLTSAS